MFYDTIVGYTLAFAGVLAYVWMLNCHIMFAKWSSVLIFSPEDDLSSQQLTSNKINSTLKKKQSVYVTFKMKTKKTYISH